MRIMLRHAEDDFAALNMANAMEGAGATVFAVAYNGQATHHGATLPHSQYIVWAKVETDEQIEAIDKAIYGEGP